MASLSDLPDDIVYEIVSHIRERKMLREISLLSRKFKIPSSVFLYRRVYGGPHTLYHFERTISERPELAKYVKQVCLRFEPAVVWSCHGNPENSVRSDLSSVKQTTKRLGFHDEYAMVNNLLPLLTCLEELQLIMKSRPKFVFLATGDRAREPDAVIDNGHLSTLKKLRKFNIKVRGTRNGPYRMDLLPLLQLPSLQKFFATRIRISDSFELPTTSKITSLYLVGSVLESCNQKMFRCCRTLESFIYRPRHRSDSELEAKLGAKPREIVEALDPVSSTLKRLCLNYWNGPRYDLDFWRNGYDADHLTGPLHKFKNLTTLEVDSTTLLGAFGSENVPSLTALLPKEITSLQINCWGFHDQQQLIGLSKECTSGFGELREIYIFGISHIIALTYLRSKFPRDVKFDLSHCEAVY
ncbi:hypothetical protein V2W45_872995 [Cenococcum geophilum]